MMLLLLPKIHPKPPFLLLCMLLFALGDGVLVVDLVLALANVRAPTDVALATQIPPLLRKRVPTNNLSSFSDSSSNELSLLAIPECLWYGFYRRQIPVA